jgi:hypothetical protein
MTVVLIVMLASMFVFGVGFCLPRKEGVTLKVELAAARTRILASGVVVFTALMPVVLGASARRSEYLLILATVFVLEAAVCIAMIAMKTRHQHRIRDAWHNRVFGKGGAE